MIVSIFSWNHSFAHFNIAITIGEMILRAKSIGQVFDNFDIVLKVFIVQICGGLLSIFITFMISKITLAGASKTYYPVPPTLCPGYQNLGCAPEYLTLETCSVEFITSFIYVLSYLIVRFTVMQKNEHKWMSLVGPWLMGVIYYQVTQFSLNTAKGTSNPTVALIVLIWSSATYNAKDNPGTYKDKTVF